MVEEHPEMKEKIADLTVLADGILKDNDEEMIQCEDDDL